MEVAGDFFDRDGLHETQEPVLQDPFTQKIRIVPRRERGYQT